jgi:uncharacterized protein YjbJ (UPF0337 family)
MNEDILKGKWKQVQGDLKKWWGKLTDDDIQRIQGSSEKLAGILQERYGYTWQAANQHVAEFLEEMEQKLQVEQRQ